MALVIHAGNIHHGGGKTLLLALLACLNRRPATVFLDTRLVHQKIDPGLIIRPIAPTFAARVMGELHLKKILRPTDLLLCLGNLPPLFGVHPRTILFLQNRLLIGGKNLSPFPWRTQLRLRLERIWLRFRLSSVAHIIVQTQTMQREFYQATGRLAHVCPFIQPLAKTTPLSQSLQSPRHDFVYVASGDPHKNHHKLFEAWKILAQKDQFPSLALTIDEKVHPKLCRELAKITRDHKLQIHNYGHCGSTQELYQQSRALLYPAIFESFGLPLIEARQHGLPILASELDFVRDSCDPVQTFDPSSPLSIARAVRRFLQREEQRPRMLTPQEFFDAIDRLQFS